MRHLLTYKIVQMALYCQYTSADQIPTPCVPVASTNREVVKGGCPGALKSDRFSLSCRANKCSDAGIGDLGVLTTQETSVCFALGDVGSIRLKCK